MRRLRTHLPLLAFLGVLALVGSGCSLFGGNNRITVSATFDDVGDLVSQAAVQAGNVAIGEVTSIKLDDQQRALVTMSVKRGTGLPHNTKAVLTKTSLLGERYVDLRPADKPTGQLEDGEHLTDTKLISDFEDLVASGNDVVAYVAATQVQAMVETGARAFGGRGSLLGEFLDQVDGFVGKVDNGKKTVVDLIDALDSWTKGLAPAAETDAAALETLNRASQALQRQDDRLLDTLAQVRHLADDGTNLLAQTQQETDNFIRRLREVLQQVNRIDGALQGFLTWWPRHNLHVPTGSVGEHAQVWLDFIVCGVNDTPGSATRACNPPTPDKPNEPPPSARDNPCNESHKNCPGYKGKVRPE